MSNRTNVRYDAIVIRSGQNRLISAAYLARAGKSVLMLERREVIGGATLTEEPWPFGAPGRNCALQVLSDTEARTPASRTT